MTRAYFITVSSVCTHSHTLKKGKCSVHKTLIFPCLLVHPKKHHETSRSISMWHCQSSRRWLKFKVESIDSFQLQSFLSFASRVPFGSLVPAVFYRNWSNQMRLYNWIILTTKPPAPWLGVKGSLGWWARVPVKTSQINGKIDSDILGDTCSFWNDPSSAE